MKENKRYFISSTFMGKEENKKAAQLLQGMMDSSDSADFRLPVDYVAFGIPDYPLIVKKPMDLGTVKKNLSSNFYQTVEDCLSDIMLIWDNCRLYNSNDSYFTKLADKLDKQTRKMVKNYCPFAVFDAQHDKKRGAPKKEIVNSNKKEKLKAPPQPKNYIEQKEQKSQMISEQQIESEFAKKRKQFLMFANLCSSQQIGVIFLLIKKNSPQAINYDEQGNVSIKMEHVSQQLLKRLKDQLDMWGIGYVPTKKR